MPAKLIPAARFSPPLSPQILRRWCRDGRIPGAIRVGRELRVPAYAEYRAKTENLKKAIEELAAKAKNSSAPHEAMQFAQAALNLAHASAMLHNMK